MLKALGLVFGCLLLAFVVVLLSALLSSDFPTEYAKNNSIEVLVTVLALNVATAAFLVGSLLNIEEKVGMDVFNSSRTEIKHNILAMCITLVLNVMLVAAIAGSQRYIPGTLIEINNVLSGGVITILFFNVYLLTELITAAFRIRVPHEK